MFRFRQPSNNRAHDHGRTHHCGRVFAGAENLKQPPESEEPEHHMQEVPSEKFIIDGFHVFDFNTGGDAVGHCKLMSDTFTCSGIPEGRDGDTNEVTVAPEGIEFTIGDGPYTAQDPVDLQPGEFIEVESVRCSMMDASKLICSGPGGTISINGPEQIVHEETNN